MASLEGSESEFQSLEDFDWSVKELPRSLALIRIFRFHVARAGVQLAVIDAEALAAAPDDDRGA
eukprot:scaffold4178_cov257-Pinguiococcus_pyrenoidosus.AAC.3